MLELILAEPLAAYIVIVGSICILIHLTTKRK